MSELVHGRQHSAVELGQGGPVAVGTGRSVEDVSWDGIVIGFNELSASVPQGGGPVIASAVYDDGKTRRRRNPERYFRRRTGWQAQQDRIVVVVSEQALEPQPDGRMRPRGPWRIVSVNLHESTAPAKKRVGDVKQDDISIAGIRAPDTCAAELGEMAFEDAHDTISFLPEPVRASVIKRAALPILFTGAAIRYGGDHGTGRHEISVLRMNESEAIVVRASRLHAAVYWQVERIIYQLKPAVSAGRTVDGARFPGIAR